MSSNLGPLQYQQYNYQQPQYVQQQPQYGPQQPQYGPGIYNPGLQAINRQIEEAFEPLVTGAKEFFQLPEVKLAKDKKSFDFVASQPQRPVSPFMQIQQPQPQPQPQQQPPQQVRYVQQQQPQPQSQPQPQPQPQPQYVIVQSAERPQPNPPAPVYLQQPQTAPQQVFYIQESAPGQFVSSVNVPGTNPQFQQAASAQGRQQTPLIYPTLPQQYGRPPPGSFYMPQQSSRCGQGGS